MSSTRTLSVKKTLNTNDILDKNIMKKSPRKRRGVSENLLDINSKSNDSDGCTDIKQSKLEVTRKNGVSPRRNKCALETMKTEQEIPDVKQVKTEIKQEAPEIKQEMADDINDIEDGGWEPDNWRIVWENILKMRKLHVAPVDSLGAEECPDKDVSPEVFRYQTLISVMLSSQTRDEQTHAATQRLIEHGLTVDNILNTSVTKIGELIYPVSYWKSKAKYIKKTTQMLKDNYNSDVPRTLKELCKLTGVGPKMANIVMSVGWNETVGIAVDTHVHRISNRLGWVKKPTKTPEETRKALESWLPKNLWRPVNITLVGFGQTVCKPVGPSCDSCLNKTICPSAGKKSPSKKKEKK